MMQNRRTFLQSLAAAGASTALPRRAFGESKSLLVFTKSSGFEHDVVKRTDGKASIVEKVVEGICKKHGYEVHCTKDGGIFSSQELSRFQGIFFFTTGDLTEIGTDKNPAMAREGKERLLSAIRGGTGFVGAHAAADTFHTAPDPQDLSNRYIAHGEKSDAYLQMLGGEFIIHGSSPRLQAANIIIEDAKFPGLEGMHGPVNFTEEWYSLKDFAPDLHVIATLDTTGMKGECYARPRYPMTWAHKYGEGRVFYTAIGDRAENWGEPFFLNLLEGGIGVGPGEIRKDPPGAIKKLAHFLERDDRVLEGRLLRLGRDGRGFLLFLRDPLLQRRLKMLVLDLVEGRHLIGQSAFSEERIAGRGGGHFFRRAW
jgi:type 1 glutamine amidotransferase